MHSTRIKVHGPKRGPQLKMCMHLVRIVAADNLEEQNILQLYANSL